jgi:hypothetical protein
MTAEFASPVGMLAEGSSVLAKGSEPSTISAETNSDNCSVHSNNSDDWNVHSSDVVDVDAGVVPTQETYEQLQTAYDYLKKDPIEKILEDRLPNCLITLQRHKGTYGYFAPDRFGHKDGHRTDEIALNPQHFRDGTEEILSTLAHEMIHLWQHHFGKPGRGRYHNSEWAAKMRHVGLYPSDTGKEGGKQTGDSMSHYIVADGPFARAVQKLLASGFEITWTEVKPKEPRLPDGDGTESDGDRGSLSGKRTKYTCPQCDLNAWARAGAELLCGKDRTKMEPAN